jgi:Na+-driven multidrug efflux pump
VHGLWPPRHRAITSAFSSIATGIRVPVARRSGERVHPGSGGMLNNPLDFSLALDLFFGARVFSVLFLGLPGFLFSYDIVNFDCVFFFSVTFPSAYRRTYKYPGRFRIRDEGIRQIVKISLPVSFQNSLISRGFLVFMAAAVVIGISGPSTSCLFRKT